MMRRAAVAFLLLSLAVPAFSHAAPAWSMVRSEHFTLVGDAGEKSLHEVALRLEQFRAVIARLMPNAKVSASVPTIVVVFGSGKAFDPFRPRYQNKPVPVGGYFVQGPDANYVALTLDTGDESFRVICHEYTHFLVGNSVASVPVWLNEGLAEFYSTFAMKSDGKAAFIGRVIPYHIHALNREFIPLTELMAVDRNSPLYNEGERRSIFYGESWALVHYLLMESPDAKSQINRYVTALANGEPADRAFAAAFGTDQRELETRLRAYVSRGIYRSIQFSFSDRIDADRGERGRPLSPAEIEAWSGDLLVHIGRGDDARARLQQAIALDANVPRAHLALGVLALRDHRDAEAWPHLQRAVALDPNNFVAQYTYGLSILRSRAEQAVDTVAPGVEDARAALAKAVALEPDATDPLVWLAYADLMLDDHLDEALTVVRRAVSLAPGRLDYVLRLAEVYARRQHLAEARRLLTALTTKSDAIGTADAARSLLNRLDAAERRGAAPHPASSAGAGGTRFVPSFRAVKPGEVKQYATLERIECAADHVILHFRAGDAPLRARAHRLGDVEFISYRDDLKGSVNCGLREPPDLVYATLRSAADRTIDEVVAVEFLPKGYTPR